MFYKSTDEGKIIVLLVYVDGMILIGNDHVEIEALRKILAKEFEVKDLGVLRYFLGMEIARNKNGISVSKKKVHFRLTKGNMDALLQAQRHSD